MANRKPRGRKQTPATVEQTKAILKAAQLGVSVLLAWHPTSIPLTIVTQQLAAMEGELNGQKAGALVFGQPGIVTGEADGS